MTEKTRHEQQATGTHPAPCTRFCEANAFAIEIRNLKSQIESLSKQTFIQRIPDGWKLVPVRATQEMLDAADRAANEFDASESGVWLGAKSYWEAMMEAAPNAEVSGAGTASAAPPGSAWQTNERTGDELQHQ